jgi:hypothetical protein
MRCLAPTSLTKEGKHVNDLKLNIRCAIELGLVLADGEHLETTPETVKAIRSGTQEFMNLVRTRVLAPELNTDPWGGQRGARDLTNALGWFLTLPERSAPRAMESGDFSVKQLQETDFGPRIESSADEDEFDQEKSGWPIANKERWTPFMRWSNSLGFSWIDPLGRLIPDPTTAIRANLIKGRYELSADEFLLQVRTALPVLDGGSYRGFVERNMVRVEPTGPRMSEALSRAVRRLQREGLLSVDDRADADRVSFSDGTTMSHIRSGA